MYIILYFIIFVILSYVSSYDIENFDALIISFVYIDNKK